MCRMPESQPSLALPSGMHAYTATTGYKCGTRSIDVDGAPSMTPLYGVEDCMLKCDQDDACVAFEYTSETCSWVGQVDMALAANSATECYSKNDLVPQDILREGSRIFSDRETYQFTHVPTSLVGAIQFMGPREVNRQFGKGIHLELALPAASDVFVAHAPQPQLKAALEDRGFTLSSARVQWYDGQTMEIRQQSLAKGIHRIPGGTLMAVLLKQTSRDAPPLVPLRGLRAWFHFGGWEDSDQRWYSSWDHDNSEWFGGWDDTNGEWTARPGDPAFSATNKFVQSSSGSVTSVTNAAGTHSS